MRFVRSAGPFLLLLLVTSVGPAQSDNVPLNFSRLDLSDGRKLKNVVIKSYDAKSEKLLIIAEGPRTGSVR